MSKFLHPLDLPPFIVLEGIDGSGTTSQTQRLCETLVSKEHRVHTTCEPSTGPIGKLLRDVLIGKHAPIDNTTMALLFAADRADHLAREVDPALQAKSMVISDRYLASSMVYQGLDDDMAWVQHINGRVRVPDLMIFLHVDAETAAERREKRGSPTEIFDQLETQRKLAEGYRQVASALSSWTEIVELDGRPSFDNVADEIWNEVELLISKRS